MPELVFTVTCETFGYRAERPTRGAGVDDALTHRGKNLGHVVTVRNPGESPLTVGGKQMLEKIATALEALAAMPKDSPATVLAIPTPASVVASMVNALPRDEPAAVIAVLGAAPADTYQEEALRLREIAARLR